MIKGFLGSLVAAIVLFAAGWITIAVFGVNKPEYINESVTVEWGGKSSINESIMGEKTWYFDERSVLKEIAVDSSNVKTYIAPSTDNRLSVTVHSSGWKSVSVKAERPSDGVFKLRVTGDLFWGFMNFGGDNGTVTISLPNVIYEKLTLDLGSGVLEVRDIGAKKNEFDIGSGKFEFEQKSGFTADKLELDMGSGSAKIANAATDEYNIDIGSGSFDISGLTGNGEIEMGSGSCKVEFARTGPSKNVFDLGSGKLAVYIPDDTKADLYTNIGSGRVSVDCCGVSANISDDRHIELNGGSGDLITFYADLGSGRIDLKNSSEYKQPDMFEDFPSAHFAEKDETVISEVAVIKGQGGELMFGNSTGYAYGVTLIEADTF